MPLKPEHRPLTCMSTPRGTMQWRVLVMGLKNGNAMFQRMMEWVLREHECADPYVDDIIIGTPDPAKGTSLSDMRQTLGQCWKPSKNTNWWLTPARHTFSWLRLNFAVTF